MHIFDSLSWTNTNSQYEGARAALGMKRGVLATRI